MVHLPAVRPVRGVKGRGVQGYALGREVLVPADSLGVQVYASTTCRAYSVDQGNSRGESMTEVSPQAVGKTAAGFEVRIDLIDNKPPLSANQRLFWRRKAAVTKAVREATAWRVKSLNLPPAGRLTVQLRFDTGDNRKRRDPANLCATSKPAIDGLVDAGLVPDDTPEWVTELMPVIHNGRPERGERGMWLEVTIHPPEPEDAS